MDSESLPAPLLWSGTEGGSSAALPRMRMRRDRRAGARWLPDAVVRSSRSTALPFSAASESPKLPPRPTGVVNPYDYCEGEKGKKGGGVMGHG